METAHILCYYCRYQDGDMNNILEHYRIHHTDKTIKIKQYMLCPTTGKLELQTKSYSISSRDCDNSGKTLQYESSTNRVVKIAVTEQVPNTSQSSPPLKKAEPNAEPQAQGSRRAWRKYIKELCVRSDARVVLRLWAF